MEHIPSIKVINVVDNAIIRQEDDITRNPYRTMYMSTLRNATWNFVSAMCFISGIITTRTRKVSKDGIEDKRLDYLIVSRAYEDHHEAAQGILTVAKDSPNLLGIYCIMTP
jgi:hypothetical protein